MVSNYIEYFKARLKPTTAYNKETILKAKIIPFFGKLKLNEITPIHITKWQNSVIKEGYSQTYLKTLNNQLSSSLNYAVKFYGLRENPCVKAGSMGKKHADRKDFWTVDDFKNFLEYFNQDNLHDFKFYVFFSFLFFSGCRLGEALALTYSDIDVKKHTVTISKNYANLKGEDIILTPKTEKSKRKITLPVNIINKLWELHCKSVDKNIKARLFDFDKTVAHRALTKACNATGVEKIRIHDIRHSHATLLINMGTPVKLVSERLGHENIETTLRTYSHLYKEKEEEVTEKLDSICQKVSI